MKFPRLALAAALASTVALAACSEDDTGAATTDSTDVATGTGDVGSATGGGDGDISTGTGDVAGQSAGSDAQSSTSPATVTAAPAGEGVVSIEEAEQIAKDLLRDARASQADDDAEAARDLIRKTFRGREAKANLAAVSLRGVQTPNIDYGSRSRVLGISRAGESGKRVMVVQAFPSTEVPELHVITSLNEDDPWRIVWSAPMLPGTEVALFDRLSEGSVVLQEQGTLRYAPDDTLNFLIDRTEFPLRSSEETRNAPIRTNGYAPKVRDEAQSQADSVSGFATFSQEQSLIEESLVPLELADGSAMVFGVIDRRSTFDVKSGQLLDPPATFSVFDSSSPLDDKAEMETLVFAMVHVPNEGMPELIAVREQLVDASGS